MNRALPTEALYKLALGSDENPSAELNSAMRECIQARGQTTGKRRQVSRVLLIAAIVTALLSSTALAIWLLRSPSETAQKSPDLAAFLSGEDTVVIDQAVDIDGYRITLLGIAQGDALVALDIPYIESGATYIVTAVQKMDGGDMPSVTSTEYRARPFRVHAYVQGVRPWQFRLTDAAATEIIDGIQFTLTNTADVEPFSDRGVYLTVSHDTGFNTNAYHYDEETGVVTRNESYDGVNALFTLPLDPAKADHERAGEILRGPEPVEEELPPAIDIDENGEFTLPPSDDHVARMYLGMELGYYYLDRPLEEFTLREDIVKACPVVDGFIKYGYEYEIEEGSTTAAIDADGSGGYPFSSDMFQDSSSYTFGMSPHWLRSREGYYMIERQVFYLDDDGVIWQMIYTITSDKIPQEVIEGYNRRLAEQTP